MIADGQYVGLEDVIARVGELRSMTQSALVGRSGQDLGEAASLRSHAFNSELQSQLLSSFSGISPQQLSALTPTGNGTSLATSSSGLGIQSLLAGIMPQDESSQASSPIASRLNGDLRGLDPQLRNKLERLAQELGQSIEVKSGLRTRSEQAELYRKYLNGTGNLAARPGTSNHESGRAADVYIKGTALANVAGAREAATRLGLSFPVRGEAWHVESAS